MSDDERDIEGVSSAEQELARRLTRLGPEMREQERAEIEIDQVFARTLRAHMVNGEERAPHPGFARTLREHLMRERTAARPVPSPSQPRPLVWIGAAMTALLAVLVGLIVTVLGPQHAQVVSFKAPSPTRADLIFSFPAPPIEIHGLTPTASLVHPRSGVAYAGHLQLSVGRLPSTPPTLRAYRLASPSNVVIAGRRLLGIRSRVRHLAAGSAIWAVAADGGSPSRRPLHSLSVSVASGELVYHDRRNLALPRATIALPPSTAVTVAREWLTRLGWPGSRMPLVAVENVRTMPKVREVEFGWTGVRTVATDAATLWVTPNRSVIEAWVWPPVVQRATVPARPISAAWTEVRKGTLPLAVEGVPPRTRTTGVGTERRTTVLSILTSGSAGTLYLVPAYRFEGKAHIPGASVHAWFGLAPGAQK